MPLPSLPFEDNPAPVGGGVGPAVDAGFLNTVVDKLNTLTANGTVATQRLDALPSQYATATRSGAPAVGRGEIVFNVKDYGAAGDGATDDTAAINAAINAMPSVAGAFGGVSGVLHFPAGRYLTDGGHVIPADKRMTIRGDGPYVSILYKRAGGADLLTIGAKNSGIADITLDGNRGNSPGGDLLVLDAAWAYAKDSTIANAYGNGITIGKGGGAIGHQLLNLDIRLCLGYGVHVIGGSGSTDGQWCNVGIGMSGLSGARIGTGAQLLLNVHAWGNGLESTTDRAGIWLNSTANHLVNCESETNLGVGFSIGSAGSDANSLVGCFSWGNVAAGIYGFQANRTVLAGNSIYNNGVTNTTGTTSPAFAGIHNESCSEWVITGNSIWDSGAAVPAGSYTTPPTYPYPGRTAQSTQSYAYAEVNTGSGVPNFNVISGNVMRKERTRSGIAYINIGGDNRWTGNVLGAIAIPAVASAATVALSADSDFVDITGAVTITSITASYLGRRVTLRFTAATPGIVTDGGNLRLAGNLTATTDDTLTLVCDGTNWHEVARSAN